MKLKLIEKRDEAVGTKSFFWLPEESVSFLPGQYFYFTLPELHYSDDRGVTRHFTISNSPTETRLIRFTTRMRETSGYKKTLDELPIGSEITGSGPNGTFYFDEKDKSPHIFLAGGIGVSAFRSIISYNLTSNLDIPMYLLLSDSNEDEFVFTKDITEWDKNYDYFAAKMVTTSKDGRIDEQKIKSFFEDCKNKTLEPMEISKCSWWVCGPPPFVDAMEKILGDIKVPNDLIHSEKFTGY